MAEGGILSCHGVEVLARDLTAGSLLEGEEIAADTRYYPAGFNSSLFPRTAEKEEHDEMGVNPSPWGHGSPCC